MSWLQRSWHQATLAFPKYPRRRWLSPVFYGHYRTVLPLLRTYAHGALLDLGAGTAPFKDLAEPQATCYHTLDRREGLAALTFRADIMDLAWIDPESYDTVLCLEVLEHLPNPQATLLQVHRILRPAGAVILSVPHLSRLHDEPDDYFRFTRHGLSVLLAKAGFQVMSCQETGGLATFLGHQVSGAIVSAVWPLPLAREIALFLNGALVVLPSRFLDRLFSLQRAFASGYALAAQKDGRKPGEP